MIKANKIKFYKVFLVIISAIVYTIASGFPASSQESENLNDSSLEGVTESGNTIVKSEYKITDLGIVQVVESWRNMKMESGIYPLFSATRESGIIPVRVEKGKFTVNFATRSYLKREEGRLYFVTPDYYYDQSPLDVEITLYYPSNLEFLTSNVTPTYTESGLIKWQLKDVSHKVIVAEMNQISPFAAPYYPTGPLYQVDPTTLPELTNEDIPNSPDEVLKELEVIIKMLSADKSTDPDVVRVLRKTLSKFYYMFAVYGLVKEYVPEGAKSE